VPDDRVRIPVHGLHDTDSPRARVPRTRTRPPTARGRLGPN
jgi:hypothetical protein